MRTLAAVLTAACAAIAAAPAGAQVGGNTVGPDYVTSPNVQYLGSLKADIGQTTGARIVGKKLYVTSAKNLATCFFSALNCPGVTACWPAGAVVA